MRTRTASPRPKPTRPATICGDALIASLPPERRGDVIPPLTARDAYSGRRLWRRRAHPAQLPPEEGDWRTWLFLGGRGAGKTWAGARWLTEQAHLTGRLALVGPSLHDVREVMVEGPSGLRSCAPRGARPRYEPSRRRFLWGNGAVAHAFSAEDPESLRGPQFGAAWADEFCAWRGGGDTLALLRMGLRLGDDPRLAVTTTPRPTAALRALMAEPSCVVSRMATADNAANLAPGFLDALDALYGGTRLAAQELEGLVTEADEGALWRAADLQRCRGAAPAAFEAVVVAVDPPATATGDACGIVAVGREGRRAYVLEDASVAGLSPLGWAARVAETVGRWGAGRVVAEVNQGGDMVRTVLASAGCAAPVKSVHASRSKRARAAPVAALYEQGRVVHTRAFPLLEEELMALGAAEGGPSPDRADALVWAVTDLLLGREAALPRVRTL